MSRFTIAAGDVPEASAGFAAIRTVVAVFIRAVGAILTGQNLHIRDGFAGGICTT